jgi:propionyl-CoA carboxylase beta chain
MGADGACNIIYRREISGAPDPAAKRAELAAAYETQFNNPYFPAGLGIVDEIILPRETRKKVVAILDAFHDKTQTRLVKKHNNMPM